MSGSFVDGIMDQEAIINERVQKLKEMRSLMHDIDQKLLSLSKEFNWDYKKLLEEGSSQMVICTFNNQHRVPASKIEVHEEKCSWYYQGYTDTDKIFPEHSGSGSFVTLTTESVQSIIQKVSSCPVLVKRCLFYIMQIKTNQAECLRALPQSSSNFDQNFNREEKLAIYDYVIANTQNQKSYSDFCFQSVEKTVEKREMAAWEIAAAERDAKRRRASYRNKVHTNRKTHTEILREVINAQMEAFELEAKNEKSEDRMEKPKTEHRSYGHDRFASVDVREKRKHEPGRPPNREERYNRKSNMGYPKHRERKRSPPVSGSESKSGSRSDDKSRKWKTYEGRSHSHRSSYSHRR